GLWIEASILLCVVQVPADERRASLSLYQTEISSELHNCRNNLSCFRGCYLEGFTILHANIIKKFYDIL
ncbi:mCG145927, partial [Mus musculus]